MIVAFLSRTHLLFVCFLFIFWFINEKLIFNKETLFQKPNIYKVEAKFTELLKFGILTIKQYT